MIYRTLLLDLKKMIKNKGNIRVELVQNYLYLSCCLFSSRDKMIPLPLQHYIDKKHFLNEAFEPFFHITNNKIYLLQKIPFREVISLRQAYEDFSAKAEKYNKIINNFSSENADFFFAVQL